MVQRINSQRCVEVLLYIAGVIESNKDYLTELDSAIGDGDLGISMTLGFRAVREIVPNMSNKSIGNILKECGVAFSNNAPSTIGALLATGFLRAGSMIGEKTEVDSSDILLMVEAATEGIQQRGRAKLGDKTLLDALIPALNVGRTKADNEIDDLLMCMLDAAEHGVESTKEMRSTQGRSRWLQDRSIGHIDPGAAVVAIILKSCVEWVEKTQ
jgi:dihydroxyacetone kinase-like protein